MSPQYVLLFKDGSLKCIEKLDELNGSIEWSPIIYDEHDILIASDLSLYRFCQQDGIDIFTSKLKGSNILPADLTLDARNSIIRKLEFCLSNDELTDDEKSFVSKVYEGIKNT